MLEIIPAIDLIDGKCVRLSQGDYERKIIYHEDPLDAALAYEDAGIRRVHLVDLDGARKGKVQNLKVLERIALRTKLVIDFGGGIKTNEDIYEVFEAGAGIAAIGTIAAKDPEMFFSWLKKYGAERILLGADVKNERIAVSGWMEQTSISIFDFINTNVEKGLKNIFCTDISKDGMMQGSAIDLYTELLKQFPDISLIASGGVSSEKDLDDLQRIGCSGVIIGKALYEGKIKLDKLKIYL